ncbi:lachrymatory-factor synthase-like [Quillaja saponaria]|uniref:Lachrymatory-factor synthase-like n=1 Tax=Quillaja saponaria TaxID=32244 RepID=A0AAD7LXF2_QUISA|nr:lachrymatory-factor synthase-like [Quillaja saponaria]
MEEENKPKWDYTASVELAAGLTETQVWPLLEDFCNLHKWFPIDTCYQVDGVPGQPGLIRYTAATTTTTPSSGSDGHDVKVIKWAKEKLLMIDPIQRCLSYEVIDNNIGMKSYVATIKVLPINGHDNNDDHNGTNQQCLIVVDNAVAYSDHGFPCKIELSFVCDPVEGWKLEDFVAYVEYCLQFMANKMEDALLPIR